MTDKKEELEALFEYKSYLLIQYAKGQGDQQELDDEINEITFQINKLRRELNHD